MYCQKARDQKVTLKVKNLKEMDKEKFTNDIRVQNNLLATEDDSILCKTFNSGIKSILIVHRKASDVAAIDEVVF